MYNSCYLNRIHTAEVLKFWVSNETNNNDMFDYERAVVYKNSTFGALKMCWRDRKR